MGNQKINKVFKILIIFFLLLFHWFYKELYLLCFPEKKIYYALTLITIFNVISPIFRTCLLQHYYINTSYSHMPYSTVMKLTIIYSCAKGHTTIQFFFFFVIGRNTGGREYAGKTGHPQRFAMQFSSLPCFPEKNDVWHVVSDHHFHRHIAHFQQCFLQSYYNGIDKCLTIGLLS